MSVDLIGPDAIRALQPLEVASYQRVQGWHQETDLDAKGSLWLLTAPDADVLLPLQRNLGDFELRMRQVLETLARVEQRPEPEVLQDIVSNGSDLIRVRAPSQDADPGSLPLEQAVVFVERARDLMLAAACAAVSKRATYPTRKPNKAIEFLSRIRMGQTERGSYVLTILSPVTPLLAPQGEVSPDAEPPEPFERQVTRTLTESLAALEAAARQAAAGGGVHPFQQAIAAGVSANLCDAVTGLAAASRGEGLEVSVAWSRTRPQRAPSPSRVFLGSDRIPLIEEAARQFKETASIEDLDVEGFVTRLSRDPQAISGAATLEGFVDGALRRVSVELVGDAYSLAVQAHDMREPVVCNGDLVREKGTYRLLKPRHLRLATIEGTGG